MPKSLASAGVTNVPFFVKADMITNQPFFIREASLRTNRFNNEEVVFVLKLRDGVYDLEGELHRDVWLSLTAGDSGQRRDIVKYFRDNRDPLGPCMFTEIPTDRGNPFYRIDDVVLSDVPALEGPPPQVRPRQPRDGDTSDDDQLAF